MNQLESDLWILPPPPVWRQTPCHKIIETDNYQRRHTFVASSVVCSQDNEVCRISHGALVEVVPLHLQPVTLAWLIDALSAQKDLCTSLFGLISSHLTAFQLEVLFVCQFLSVFCMCVQYMRLSNAHVAGELFCKIYHNQKLYLHCCQCSHKNIF